MNIMMKTLIKLLIIYYKCITLKIIKNHKKCIENLYLDNYIDRIDKILDIKFRKKFI